MDGPWGVSVGPCGAGHVYPFRRKWVPLRRVFVASVQARFIRIFSADLPSVGSGRIFLRVSARISFFFLVGSSAYLARICAYLRVSARICAYQRVSARISAYLRVSARISAYLTKGG